MGTGRSILEVNLIGTDRVVRAFESILQPGSVALCFASMAAYLVPTDPAVDAIVDRPESPSMILITSTTSACGTSRGGVCRVQAWRGAAGAAPRRCRAAQGHGSSRFHQESVDTPMGRLEGANVSAMAEMTATSALGNARPTRRDRGRCRIPRIHRGLLYDRGRCPRRRWRHSPSPDADLSPAPSRGCRLHGPSRRRHTSAGPVVRVQPPRYLRAQRESRQESTWSGLHAPPPPRRNVRNGFWLFSGLQRSGRSVRIPLLIRRFRVRIPGGAR